ncbi:BrnT family toxin [Anaerobaca lacustris]|uniref:BrnT family toxin n=1 Tax=Anaerobaca lacustris TaxID=3044600 RepID=A0AAW6TXF4_9BACT|nr:BrnT family toxin [Sedimentisphaerales bacterium M17dextr]
MKIRGVIWLDSVIEKVESKHGVSCEEVRQILRGHASFRFVEKGHRRGENVYAALGRTEAGRYLVVFFVQKPDHRALILTARDMTVTERKRHERK